MYVSYRPELLAVWLREKPPMDKEIVTEAELLDAAVKHINKSSIGRWDMAHWPNHGLDMYREYLAHAIPGCTLLRERSKVKQNPDTCVRFDMPSCGWTKRGRVEIEEDAYADSLPPSSPPPTEDAAADTGAHVAGAVAELANSPLPKNEEVHVEMEEMAAAGALADHPEEPGGQ